MSDLPVEESKGSAAAQRAKCAKSADAMKGYRLADAVVSDDGSQLLYTDPDDEATYVLAESDYNNAEINVEDGALLRGALTALRAVPALLEDVRVRDERIAELEALVNANNWAYLSVQGIDSDAK